MNDYDINKWYKRWMGRIVFDKFAAEELGFTNPEVEVDFIPKPTNKLKSCVIPNITRDFLTSKGRWKYPQLIELFERHNECRFSREDVKRLNPIKVKDFEKELIPARSAVKELFLNPPTQLSPAQQLAISLFKGKDELLEEYLGEQIKADSPFEAEPIVYDNKAISTFLAMSKGSPEARILDTFIETKSLVDPSILERI